MKHSSMVSVVLIDGLKEVNKKILQFSLGILKSVSFKLIRSKVMSQQIPGPAAEETRFSIALRLENDMSDYWLDIFDFGWQGPFWARSRLLVVPQQMRRGQFVSAMRIFWNEDVARIRIEKGLYSHYYGESPAQKIKVRDHVVRISSDLLSEDVVFDMKKAWSRKSRIPLITRYDDDGSHLIVSHDGYFIRLSPDDQAEEGWKALISLEKPTKF